MSSLRVRRLIIQKKARFGCKICRMNSYRKYNRVEFIEENGGGPGVRLRKRQKLIRTPSTAFRDVVNRTTSLCERPCARIEDTQGTSTGDRRNRLKLEGDMRFLVPLVGVVAFLMFAGPVSVSRALADDADTCEKATSADVAIVACTSAISSGRLQGHDLAAAYNNRGFAYMANGDYERAIDDYNQAIELDPKYAFAYNDRGVAYYGKGDYDSAITDYNQAIQLDPKYAAAYYHRGNAYYGKKDYDGAITDYNQAIQLDPKHAVAYYCRGNAYYAKRDFDLAIADYTEAIQLDPKYAAAYNYRGLAKRAKGDAVGGDADIAEAKRLEPSSGN